MTINRRALLKGLAAAPAVATAATIAGPQPASAAPEAELPEIEAGDFKLVHRTTTKSGMPATFAQVINQIQLAGALPWATVDQVIDSANRTGTVPGANPDYTGDTDYTGYTQGWVWGGDDQTGQWYPQGISTSADYQDAGHYNGRNIILVSWYDNLDETTGKGSRISFVNMTDPSNPRYRHVLLVEPYLLDPGTGGAGLPTFKAIHSHAGGIMWYGKLLYVADTWNGIRVFDTTKMLRVSTGDATTIGRQANGTYTAHNYQYVLPQIAAYDNNKPRVNGEPVRETMRFSCISLDRSTTPDSMVVAEYGEPAETAYRKRLFRFNLDATTRLLAPLPTDGKPTATKAYQIDINGVNGATSTEGKYYIARVDEDLSGDLITWVPGNYVNYNDATPKPQDLSYNRHTRWLWNMAEAPRQRLVFARSIDQLA